jgi:4-carboxymuconolactone decarboxylase
VDERERHDQGMRVRREVLGDAHVDASFGRVTDFNEEFQNLLTRYAWGEIWSRPGLPKSTRSLLTMAMLIALGRDEEFQLHVRGSANVGVSRAEIRELLMQAAIYCGIPAANHAFRLAEETLAAMDAGKA